MALTPGTRLGVYEIAAQIGEGGMGQVYRATDTTLGRQVAIKILPEPFASDPERLARFEREAKTLASLNHPHIAAIYAVEKSAGLHALVMELVEGEDLSTLIARHGHSAPAAVAPSESSSRGATTSGGGAPRAVEIDEALRIAKQVAEALEAAHEQNIIHRDLKPANIKVRTDGTVKVLDFGLAKAMDRGSGIGDWGLADATRAPTITSPALMTGAGVILGTAAYMSPEQAKGRTVDRRADVWAFGAVLFEMLTGARAFAGDDVSDTLANVLKIEPDWTRLPADVPPRVRLALGACLQKDPKQRIGDVQSVRLALDGAFETVAPEDQAGARAPASWKRVALVGTAALLLGAALAGGAMWMARPSVPLRVTHTAITLTTDLPLSPTPIALSPDGQTLAMTAGNQLVLRRLDNTKLTPLPGTEGATNPFFSPDGNWIGFVANGELRRIRLDGPNRQTIGKPGLVPSTPPYWADDDAIYFGATGQGLFRVPATGGAPTPLTQPRREAGEIGHESPQVLNEGRTILFTLQRADGIVPALLNVATGEWRAIQEIASDFARYTPSGHLLYRRGESVFAVTVPLASGTITGIPEALFDGVFASRGFAMSADGTLAYLPNSTATGSEGKISIISRSGAVTTVVDDSIVQLIATSGLRLSPDAEAMVASTSSAPNTSDLWIYDLRRMARTQLTEQGPVNSSPVWSPDGKQVAFNSTREPAGIYLQSIGVPDAAKLLLKRGPGPQNPGGWSADARTLVFVESSPRTGGDLWTLTLDGKASPLLATPAQELAPRLSPDGRWLVYQSDTAGRADVYVASFPTLGGTQLVSIDGGTSPRWAGEREIVYRRGRDVLSVSVTPGEKLTLGRPTVLFEVDDVSDQYDVSSDGTKFLMLRRDAAREGGAPGQVNLVLNLFEELKRRVPTK